MNYFICLKVIGLLLITFGVSMVPSLLWSIELGDGQADVFIEAMFITIAWGGAMYGIGRLRAEEMFRREATAIVVLAWICSAIAAALPYRIAAPEGMDTFVNCFFEAVSGLTTTGASILEDIEGLPPSLLFWRAWTHWIGGLGIIMLFVAVLPFLGAGGRALVRSEVSGPVKDGLTPRIKDTALLLWRVYLLLTLAETLLFVMAGMPLFDAVCHSFATLATGGFSTRNASIGAYHSPLIEWIAIVFMILAATNFSLFHNAARKRDFREILLDSEWRTFVLILGFCSAVITFALLAEGTYDRIPEAFRHAAFSVVSVGSTTGFVTENFELWPAAGKAVLLFLMFVGGCAGSTSGSLKILRWQMLIRMARLTLQKVSEPRLIRPIKLNGRIVDDEILGAAFGLFILWILVFAAGSLGITILEQDRVNILTAMSATATTMNGVGPGLSQVGAWENFNFFGPPAKYWICFIMLLGRLEILSVLVLFSPGFWRAH